MRQIRTVEVERKKQVRSFYLDTEIGNAIDHEAESLTNGKKSELVNELLKEALDRRARARFTKSAATLTEGISAGAGVLLILWTVVVLF